jgi:hypothetical protein
MLAFDAYDMARRRGFMIVICCFFPSRWIDLPLMQIYPFCGGRGEANSADENPINTSTAISVVDRQVLNKKAEVAD